MKSFKLFENKELTYVFVGDLMQHPQQLEYESSKNFSYRGVFDEVQPILDQGDFVVGNLETLLTTNFQQPEDRSARLLTVTEGEGWVVPYDFLECPLFHGKRSVRVAMAEGRRLPGPTRIDSFQLVWGSAWVTGFLEGITWKL